MFHKPGYEKLVFCMCVCSVVSDSLQTPWTVALQAPLSMGFSRQEYLSGLPLSPAGNLPDPRIEPMSPALAGGFFTTQPPGKPLEGSLKSKIPSKHVRKALINI